METVANSVKDFGECVYFQASMAGNRGGTKYLLRMVEEEVSSINWMISTHSISTAELDAIRYKLERLKERLEDATCSTFEIEC